MGTRIIYLPDQAHQNRLFFWRPVFRRAIGRKGESRSVLERGFSNPRRYPVHLSNDVMEDVAVDIGQPHISSGIPIGEVLVVNSKLMKHGGP